MHILKKKIWPPYSVGGCIGLLTVGSYYFFHQLVGVSSAFVTITKWIGTIVNENYISKSSYFSSTALEVKDIFQVGIIIGIVIGAFISTYLSNSFTQNQTPTLWKKAFGESFAKRAIGAFLGGIIIMFGARLAGGCTSGKAISSGLQLLVPAWTFIATLFITGIITAHILYRRK